MIKKFISTNNLPFIVALRDSIKSIEVEEQLDLVVHRPLGLLFSWFAIKIKLTPLQISILSMIAGAIAGVCLFFQGNTLYISLAALFITISAVFDSSDGQVARMTGQTSVIGMIIDGLIDNIVFFSIYLGATLYYLPIHGPWFFLLACLGGVVHAFHSLVFDYYKNEVLYLYAGSDSYRNITINEARDAYINEKGGGFNKFGRFLHLNYVKEQSWFTHRKGDIKKRFEDLRNDPQKSEEFKKLYIEKNAPLMRLWALFGGSNAHRILIVIFSFFSAFDIYLLVNIVGLSIPLLILGFAQKKIDERLLNTFK